MGDVNKAPGELLGFPNLYGFDSILDWRMVSGSCGRTRLLNSPWNNRPSGEKVLTPLSNLQVNTGYDAFQRGLRTVFRSGQKHDWGRVRRGTRVAVTVPISCIPCDNKVRI